jgi:hypothetical protein
MSIQSDREAMERLLYWLALRGQGNIKGRLLEAAEEAIENGELDRKWRTTPEGIE